MATNKNYTDDGNEFCPNDLYHNFLVDDDNRPAGGVTSGQGLSLMWQDGPVENDKPNGVFVEDLIRTAIARLEWYQESEFACDENKHAILNLKAALVHQATRTRDRRERGVEGKYEK